MNPNIISCPHCKKEISVDEVLKHQIEASMKLEYEQKSKADADEIRRKAKEYLEKKEKELEAEQKANQEKLEERVKKQLIEQNELEQKMLKEEVEENKTRNKKLMDQLTEMTRELRKVREEKDNAQLEMEKKLSEEKLKLQEVAEKKIKEEFQLSIAEKDKMLSDALKANEDLKQKLTQSSQQLQGEVQELELEEVLQREFPFDEITPVPKGITGADTMQKVRDQTGRVCGVIIWESKRTKSWEEGWVAKLKSDMRSAKSDLAILISNHLPKDINNFGPKDGIYVTNFENFLAVAKIMRLKIIEICYAKLATDGVKGQKEILWNYVTGNEFKQRVEAIVEAFNMMKVGLEKEKQYFAKKWSRDEKLIDTVINQTIGMHGDLQGLMGASLPEIKSLEMDEFEMIETTTTVVQTSITSENVEES